MRPRSSSFAEYMVESKTESPGFLGRKLCNVEGLGSRRGRWPDCDAAVEADVRGASDEKSQPRTAGAPNNLRKSKMVKHCMKGQYNL